MSKSPERRILDEIDKMDKADTLYDRLLYVTDQWRSSTGTEEKDSRMWEIDHHLDTILDEDLASIMGHIALERSHD